MRAEIINQIDDSAIMEMTTEAASSYVRYNVVSTQDISRVIKGIHAALKNLANPQEPKPEKPVPAFSIRSSAKKDYTVCLKNRKNIKMLKRYLKTACDIMPDDYRGKWGLPADHTMAGPDYAAKRNKLAKRLVLVRRVRANGSIWFRWSPLINEAQRRSPRTHLAITRS